MGTPSPGNQGQSLRANAEILIGPQTLSREGLIAIWGAINEAFKHGVPPEPRQGLRNHIAYHGAQAAAFSTLVLVLVPESEVGRPESCFWTQVAALVRA